MSLRIAPPADSALAHAARLFLQYLRVECGLTGNTLESYARDLRAFAALIPPERTPEEVDPDDVFAFVSELARREYAPSTRARMLVGVRMFFRFCVNEGLAKEDPCRRAESPKLWKLLPVDLSVDEVSRLLAAPSGKTAKEGRDRAILELFYATGARVSEVCALGVADINLSEGWARVQGKGSRERIVLLGIPAVMAVTAYLDDRRVRPARLFDPSRLFRSRTGRGLERTAIFRVVKAAARRAGIEKNVYPHLLRHSFATHLLEGGANLRVVQALLGHARLTTTEIYTHVDIRRKQETHAKFHPRG